ncbi:hypothetical protein L0156_12860 [bacterium]|nr:hypothetical protein [bacterium]
MKNYLFLLLVFCFGPDLYALSFFTGPMRNWAQVEYALEATQASMSYRRGDRELSKKYLQRILEKNAGDSYANQFLGTLFLMDGNLEAALKYWNRLGKPLIENIQLEPHPDVDPELLDRALVMAPASSLTREDYLATESRLQMMGVFRKQEFELKPHKKEEKFDLIVRPSVKKGAFSSKIKMATLAAQGVFTETVQLEFPNIEGTTISASSLISWDEFKNRFYSSLSLPFGRHPHMRIRSFSDTRKETWALAPDVDLLKWQGGVELAESVNGNWKWNSGAKVSHRNYDNIGSFSASFQEGWVIQAFANFDFSLLRIPERRFNVKSNLNTEVGKLLHSFSSPFLMLENSVEMRWFPRPAGEDLAMTGRFRTGKIFGEVPFDESFVLGVERDTDLLLRAHKSQSDKKGENPFASAYALWNWDISKIVVDKKRYRLKLTPFLDVGKIFDSQLWRGKQWFVDTGIQTGVQIFGAPELVLTFGKDLRTGRNVVYFSARL